MYSSTFALFQASEKGQLERSVERPCFDEEKLYIPSNMHGGHFSEEKGRPEMSGELSNTN